MPRLHLLIAIVCVASLFGCTSKSYRLAGVQAFVVARTPGAAPVGELAAVAEIKAGQQAGIAIRLHHEAADSSSDHLYVSHINSLGIEGGGEELAGLVRIDTSLHLAALAPSPPDSLARLLLGQAGPPPYTDLNGFIQGYNQRRHTQPQVLLWLPADYAPGRAVAFEVVLQLADGGLLFTRTAPVRFQ